MPRCVGRGYGNYIETGPSHPRMAWWRTKDSVYLFFGALLFLVGILGLFGAAGYQASVPQTDPNYNPNVLPIVGGLCALGGVLPGALLLFLGFRARRREGELVEFAAWVHTYRRIGFVDLARKLKKTPTDTEKILVEVADRGLVRGFIDRATNEFVIQEAIGQEVFIDHCPRCGASVQQRYLVGETIRCPYCTSVIPPAAGRPA